MINKKNTSKEFCAFGGMGNLTYPKLTTPERRRLWSEHAKLQRQLTERYQNIAEQGAQSHVHETKIATKI